MPPQPTTLLHIGAEANPVQLMANVLADPGRVITAAADRPFSRITPQYPGVRAPVAPELEAQLLDIVSLAGPAFGLEPATWTGQAWYSMVTTPPAALAPIQRLPHVDGLDPNQLAIMLYLHRTPHGGTAFYRHRGTQFEAITAARWPIYRAAVEAELARNGPPPPAYPADGGRLYERLWQAPGDFNSLVIYRGCALHSGSIALDSPLSADPREGRLTINGFYRPAAL